MDTVPSEIQQNTSQLMDVARILDISGGPIMYLGW